MNLKPFNLEAAKAGAQVVTRDGRKVRIAFFDGRIRSDKTVVALVTQSNGTEVLLTFYPNGAYVGVGEQPVDLMMAPVKRTVYINVFKDKLGYTVSELHDEEEEAHVAAEEGIEDGCTYYHIAMPVEIEE